MISFLPLIMNIEQQEGVATPAKVIGEQSSLGDKKPLDGEEIAVIETKFGRILLRFYSDQAPGHVANFKKLAKEEFYNGTLFHRVIPDFMIQGGDPNSKNEDKSLHGTGGPGYSIKAEFNNVTHDRGVLSMARSNDPDSAGSQFFICVKHVAFLDNKYTAFGRVVRDGTEREGEEPASLKVADAIVAQPRDPRDNPNERNTIKISLQKWPLKE
jgi:peptidyl-prolyl cis-trans isomerase B (cyclophilin B)